MERLFQTILSMSGTASVVILAVLLARVLLRKAPKVFSYALWAVVLFRLLCPVSIPSPVGVLQPVQAAAPGRGAVMDVLKVTPGETGTAISAGDIQVHNPGPAVTFTPAEPVNAPVIPDAEPGTPARTERSLPGPWAVAGALWLTGVVLLLGYSALSALKLRRKLAESLPLAGEKDVRLADHIPSPFVLGLARPRIYLPSGLPEGERDYILLHERTHIRRLDHVTRALAWLALSIHWFNPLVWLAFHLAGKDMEMSCDEAVLRKMGRDVRADYSTSLLRLSVGGRLPAGPLAFGGGDPQSRIKNVLHYKKPAFWVVVLALAAVLCAGVALATDRSTFIDPDSVVSVTYFQAAFHTTTPEHTGVYTAADVQKDLLDPTDPYVLFQEDGLELVRLINSHRKSVYGQGELTLNGWEHHLTRLDCADGDFYLVDYWYWNGFSFHPLHFGEDSYTTLVTYYDAEGKPGTTWQMEYGFDRAYREWLENISRPDRVGKVVAGVPADLTLSLDQSEDGVPFVRVKGTVDGVSQERTLWYPPEWFENYEVSAYPLGQLWFEAPLCGNEASGTLDACWTDESRTAVKVTATPRAMISSYSHAGNLIFTVDLSRNGGTLVELEGYLPKLAPGAPELVPTEEEAVRAGRIAAKLLTAAEDFYANAQSASPIGFTPVYTMYEPGRVRVEGDGLGRRAFLEWSSSGELYFAGDPGGLCPALAGKSVEGSAVWTGQDKTALEVLFNVGDERVTDETGSGFRVAFTVDLDGGKVIERDFQSQITGESLTLTDQEMLDMAHIAAELMRGAENYYKSDPPLVPAESFEPPAVLGVSYSLNADTTRVDIGGLDCAGAGWMPPSALGDVDLWHGFGLPESGALGYLTMENPRFLGGYFAGAYGYGSAAYYPEEDSPLLVMGFTDYTESVYDDGEIIFIVDLASGEVTHREMGGYRGQTPEISDREMVTMARLLAGLIQGAADRWDALSNPPAEEGLLPFDTPMGLWFGSGAGGWRTIMTLHPDGSFEGDYSDANLGEIGEGYHSTEYVCQFHGKFGNIQQVTAASWSMTLEELTLDTGHPVGEQWIAERRLYISSTPYGLTKRIDGNDVTLEPGAKFMFYTPEASGKPGGELYGMENESSELNQFWYWWPNRYAISGGGGSALGCYALCSMESGYGFFDLQAWGVVR